MTNHTDPHFIGNMPSGMLFLSDMQFLRGYCILTANPTVPSINDLSTPGRECFFQDMARVGDALLKITGAYRINYAILGNSDPVLHAHIIPRYASEPEEYLHELPWSYPAFWIEKKRFDLNRDKTLLLEIAAVLG